MHRRPRLALLALLTLCLGPSAALAAPDTEGRNPSLRVDGTRIVLTWTGPSEIAGELPVAGRLVPLPAGARTLVPGEIRCSAPGRGVEIAGGPSDLVAVGRPMAFREHRWVPVTLRPYGVDGDTGEIVRYDRVEVVLEPDPAAAKGAESGGGPVDATPSEALLSAIGQDGTTGYLIISAPQYAASMSPLVEWKRRKGYEVTLVTTSQTGSSLTSIQNYIRTAYETWEHPPLYVLLVGDVDDLPTFYFEGDVSDHPYAMIDDRDYLPDLFVGRFSVEDSYEAQTLVAKSVNYERQPYTAGGTEWFSHALLVAGDYGSSTPVQTSRFCRERLEGVGFTQIDSVYAYEDGSGIWNGIEPITAAIDSGVSVVNYRGWAFGINGWQPPWFETANIGALRNGWKLPVVFSCVCHTGNFGADSETFGEAWLRTGGPTEPRGAVAFVGNGDPWSYTRWNDRMSYGLYESMLKDGLRRVGPLLADAKIRLIEQFPSELWFSETADQSVEFYFHIYNLQGDPELTIWTGAPQELSVTHPSSIPVGTDFIEVRVEDASKGTPVEGARVGIVQGNEVLGSAHTDATGIALVPAVPEAGADSVRITVTGPNLMPYEGAAGVAVPSAFLAYSGHDLDDDDSGQSAGNGDGILNPGETVEIGVSLTNTGTSSATGVSATVDTLWGAERVTGTTTFADIGPAAVVASDSALVLRVDPAAADGQVVRVRLDASFGGSSHSTSYFTLHVAAPDPVFLGAVASADSILDAGESAAMTVRLVNSGTAGASAMDAILRTTTSWISITDSLGTYGAFAPGDTAENTVDGFAVTVDAEAATGQAGSFQMELTTDEGAVSTVTFAVVVGRTDHSAPMGPDAYGYYCYDNTDIDYGAHPTYGWIHCSPAYGGLGQNLSIRDDRYKVVALPFDFTFYGVSYDSILVSDNGWFSFDLSWYRDFNNWHLPDSYGNFGMVAPFWENLAPRRRIDGVLVADGVYAWSDTVGHRFVLEWSRIPYYEEIQNDDLLSFEVILYDPVHFPTSTVDGEIVFQYKQVVDVDHKYQQATVGIEDHTETVGLEYVFSGIYPETSAPLSNGLAVKFTTRPPVRTVTHKDAEVLAGDRPGLSSWPNPFNPSTTIRLSLREPGRVSVNVYDVLGRQVASLVDGTFPAGTHDLPWDAGDLASGVYFCRMETGKGSETIKVMLLR